MNGGTAMSEKHGTASEGRVLEFALTVARNAPRDLSSEIMDAWDKKGDIMNLRLREALASGPPAEEAATQHPVIPTMPADGEIFELKLDGDAPENQPMEMVRDFGYDPRGWRHTGKKVAGKQIRLFKRVGAGYCRDLDKVQEKLASHGEIPEGQWIMAFKKAYLQSDGKSTGIADPSWVGPVGFANFPYVASDGVSRFGWAVGDRGDRWRWLVACKCE
jgi:hypothetical protein